MRLYSQIAKVILHKENLLTTKTEWTTIIIRKRVYRFVESENKLRDQYKQYQNKQV